MLFLCDNRNFIHLKKLKIFVWTYHVCVRVFKAFLQKSQKCLFFRFTGTCFLGKWHNPFLSRRLSQTDLGFDPPHIREIIRLTLIIFRTRTKTLSLSLSEAHLSVFKLSHSLLLNYFFVKLSHFVSQTHTISLSLSLLWTPSIYLSSLTHGHALSPLCPITHSHSCTHKFMHTLVLTHKNRTQTHTHTHTHTHMHTHTHTPVFLFYWIKI